MKINDEIIIALSKGRILKEGLELLDELEIKRREDNILKCFNKNISLAKYIEDFVRKNNTKKDK